jgi:hypothetical protein
MNSMFFSGEKNFRWNPQAQSSNRKAQGKFPRPSFNLRRKEFCRVKIWNLDFGYFSNFEL